MSRQAAAACRVSSSPRGGGSPRRSTSSKMGLGRPTSRSRRSSCTAGESCEADQIRSEQRVAEMVHVVVSRLIKKYGELEVVHGIDFEIVDGEFLVLVGPSGCGKSTILRMIAGLETVTGGEIKIDDRVVNDMPPRERDIAMVFQDYALYPHMSVRQNLGFGLKMRSVPRARIAAQVKRTAEILQIEGLLDRKPKELSGGQRQRVAIGRAIAREPELFLFDEPLSNLDAKLRVEMRTQIKRLHLS